MRFFWKKQKQKLKGRQANHDLPASREKRCACALANQHSTFGILVTSNLAGATDAAFHRVLEHHTKCKLRCLFRALRIGRSEVVHYSTGADGGGRVSNRALLASDGVLTVVSWLYEIDDCGRNRGREGCPAEVQGGRMGLYY